MHVFHHMSRKAVRHAASVILFGLLAALAGCGGGGGGGDKGTLPAFKPSTLKSIEVTPSLVQAAAGTTQQFTATGLYSDNSTQDLTTQVTWSSSDTAAATVSNAAGSNGLATTASVGSTTSGGSWMRSFVLPGMAMVTRSAVRWALIERLLLGRVS